MDEKELRSFLVAQPRPAKILVRTEDDDVKEVAPPTGNGVTWSHLARSISALKPVLVELQDAQGALLRAKRADVAATPSAEANLPVIHTDPETARLTHFANLLYRATEFSTKTAFEKMVELFQMQTDRMVAIEQRLERSEASYRRTMQERIDDALDEAQQIREMAASGNKEGALGMLEGFAQAFLSGKSEAGEAPKKPNGSA